MIQWVTSNPALSLPVHQGNLWVDLERPQTLPEVTIFYFSSDNTAMKLDCPCDNSLRLNELLLKNSVVVGI